MPDLVGSSVEDAETMLHRRQLRWRYRLKFAEATRFSETFDRPQSFQTDPATPEKVIDQDPRAGQRVRSGDLVTLETNCAEGCG